MSSFQGRDTNSQDFWQKINILKGNYCILRIDIVLSRLKLGIISENKVSQNLIWKSDFGFTHHYVNSQTKIISFEDVDFWPKNFWFCIPPLKTRQPILPCLHVSGLSCKGWQSGWWRKGQDQTHFQRKYCQGKGFSVVEFQTLKTVTSFSGSVLLFLKSILYHQINYCDL